MEIILSKQCKFLTGSLGKGFGYHIQRRTDPDGKIRFWGVRQSKGEIPADGHLRFILTCAELAQMKLHIADIRVAGWELYLALEEAGYDSRLIGLVSINVLYNAESVLTFKNNWLK